MNSRYCFIQNYVKPQKNIDGTYTDAQLALERWKEELEEENEAITHDITFGQYSAIWLEQKRRSDIKPDSYVSEKWRVDAVNYFFRDKKLIDITEDDVRSFLWEMKQGNTATHRRYRSSYRYDVFTRLTQLFALT